MEKKFLLIVNPVSGKGKAKSALTPVLCEFAKYGWRATVYMTTKRGEATEYARAHGGEYETLVCIGGDGTLSEVINGLMDIEERPVIGYIPMGTTNDVAACLKLPKELPDLVKKIVEGNFTNYDVGLFDGKYFSYVAAFGAFTEASYSASQEVKQTLGRVAYLLEGVKCLPKISAKHAKVEYDGGELEGDFIFGAVTNSTRVAGMVKLDPNTVLLHDGLFETLLIRKPKNIANLNNIVSNILKQKYTDESVEYIHSGKIKFTFDEPVSWTRDGENGGAFEEAELVNIKHAVKIII